jgi:release factor glutamine methyltransferase
MRAAGKDSWTILEILRWTADYFLNKGVPEPRASAEVLLAHVLGLSRLDLYLRFEQPLTPEELARFKKLIVRRAQGEPVAYLTGHKEFWSLNFRVSPAVLIPRPETEILVAAILETSQPTKAGRAPTTASPWGLEVGVGSGAVIISLAKELPQTAWVGVDISREALGVAQDNARRHEVAGRLHFLQGHLLSGLKPGPRFALLVANLPYVTQAEWEVLPRGIWEFEPQEALLAGADGLDLLRPLCRQAHEFLITGGWLGLEVGPGQAEPVMALLKETEAYDLVESVKDYQAIQRVVRARRGAS